MKEFSFYQFTEIVPAECCCDLAIPVKASNDISFYSDFEVSQVDYADNYGNPIKRATSIITGHHVELNDDLSAVLACEDCFRVRLTVGDKFYFSNVLSYIGCKSVELSGVEYVNNENAFGFTYSANKKRNKVLLPVRLHNAQYPQSDKVYQKTSGERKVLFAKIDKEYELETDYMPEEWHRNLIVALAHDTVWINGEMLTKTGEYKIEWDNKITTECGVVLVKASTKMSTNVTVRNSNCE